MISLLAVLVLGLIAGGVWHVWSRQQASRSWPAVEGEVVSARIVESDDGSNNGEGSRRFTVEVEYTYTLGGQRYRGTRIRYAHQGHRERSEAEAELAGYAPGRRLKVFHDPADPAQSVLVQG
jgi:hypothetical protein